MHLDPELHSSWVAFFYFVPWEECWSELSGNFHFIFPVISLFARCAFIRQSSVSDSSVIVLGDGRKNMFWQIGMVVNNSVVEATKNWQIADREWNAKPHARFHFFCPILWQLIFHAIRSDNSFSGLWSVSITANYTLLLRVCEISDAFFVEPEWIARTEASDSFGNSNEWNLNRECYGSVWAVF